MTDSQPIPAPASQPDPVLVPIAEFRRGYQRAHASLRYHRGSATRYACIDCGNPAAQWSYNHSGVSEVAAGVVSRSTLVTYSTDLSQYDPRCRACHTAFDLAHRQVYRRAKAPAVPKPKPRVRTSRATSIPPPTPITAADVAAARAEQRRHVEQLATRARNTGGLVPPSVDEILAAFRQAEQTGTAVNLGDLFRPPRR